MQSKIEHAAERKAFQIAIGKIIDEGQKKDVSDLAHDLVKLMRTTLKGFWPESAFNTLDYVANQPDGKWARYMRRVLKETDPGILKTFLLNAGYEGGFRGYRTSAELAKKYNCNMPWIVLFDPTSACNMKCVGCWAAEYGYKQNLSYEIMEKIVREGREIGIHAYLMTGGEPLVRKADIIKLCREFPDCAFHAFTNGTLIDEQFCKDLLDVKNFVVSVSLEGFEDANDSRRGKGDFQKVMHAMDLMHQYKIPFGVSICYTSKNYKTVTSDEFLDMIISKGAVFAWYFHFMPVGMDATIELCPTPEQRKYIKDRIRWIRDLKEGKELFAIDFQNDGEFTNGCIAAGNRYFHINSKGDAEPCVFIHYSGANINNNSLLECIQQPLFREYHANQPFNKNLLRPCPMLENAGRLEQMVKKTGAHSTDLVEPEPVEHLTEVCVPYAKEWAPMADKLWRESHPEQYKDEAKADKKPEQNA